MAKLPRVEFEEHRLENGLQVLLYRDHRVPLVHLTLHYRVGSSHEKPGLSGFAHLFEHLMFQGSAHVGKTEHGRRVDAAGGSWNASTNKDRTNYHETLPSNYLALGLWLEADRMSSLALTPENFENQRQTVLEEKKQSYDNRPYGLAFLRFDELAYRNWAYAHPVIGSVEDLQKARLEDAREFHRTYYGPGNATLVLAGDLNGDALNLVRDYFEGIPDRTRPQPPDLSEPPQEEERREVLKDPLAPLPLIGLGFHMGEMGSEDYYAASVLALILSGGESSRLYRRFIYEENWATSISSGPNLYKGPELFTLWLQVQAGAETGRILEALEGELERIQQEGVSERELEKARNQLSFRFVNHLNTFSRVGETLARYAVYHGDAGLINREWERFLAVSADQISSLARRIFRRPNRTTLLVEPGTKE